MPVSEEGGETGCGDGLQALICESHVNSHILI